MAGGGALDEDTVREVIKAHQVVAAVAAPPVGEPDVPQQVRQLVVQLGRLPLLLLLRNFRFQSLLLLLLFLSRSLLPSFAAAAAAAAAGARGGGAVGSVAAVLRVVHDRGAVGVLGGHLDVQVLQKLGHPRLQRLSR